VDQEVAKTLGDLELKLQELERELTTIGHRETSAKPVHAPGKLIDEAVEQDGESIEAGGRREETMPIDGDAFGGPAVFGGEEVPSQGRPSIEHDLAVEVRETAYGEIPTPPSSPASHPPSQTVPPAQEQSAPPGPPSPATPAELPSPSTPSEFPSLSTPPGVQPPSMPAGIHPPSSPRGAHFPPPHRPDPRHSAAAEENQSVDLAELVRFRDKLAGTMDELIAEYSRLLDLKPPSRPRSGA
jgi:hypothetical protein